MSSWVDSTKHPIKRKLRWVALVIGWLLIAAILAACGIFFYHNPRVLLVVGGIAAYMGLIDLCVWVFTDDGDDDGCEQAPETG